ncbi:hypothetical protein NW752_001320 [Fusarium irregulare]|uniref:BTB domain-containing protein n=1 Tax=Fusarium irregulare TaxID=2494466 RepID=A0A9W8U6B7_9HYPO|nr:hypothetical protein NW766_010899 [Fusarium irregulare]KAJ4026380.1 hypothetical protein NW752_001320 [Fusarium irregulare]
MDDASIFPFTGEHGTSMSCLLEEGKYSDLTIECGEDTYAVHKAIICTRSPFFAARCDGDSKEAKSGVIKLPDDDPVAVKMMIRYLYTGTYKSPSTSDSSGFNGKPLQASPNLFAPSTSAATAVAPKGEPSTNPPAASTPVASVSTAQPQTSASPSAPSAPAENGFRPGSNLFAATYPAKTETSTNPPTPSAPAGNGFGAQPKVSTNSPAPSTPVTSQGTAQTQTSSNPPAPTVPATSVFAAQAKAFVNPPAASSPAASPRPVQPKHFDLWSQSKRHKSGNQPGDPTPNSFLQPVTAKPAFGPAQAPTSASGPAPARVPTPAPATPAPTPAPPRNPDFVLHAKIYALGEKYEIKDLKALALQKFSYEATIFASNQSFRDGAKEACTSTVDKDRGLRNVVVQTVLKNRYLLDQWLFQKVVKETDLGFDLLMQLRSARSLFEEYSTA